MLEEKFIFHLQPGEETISRENTDIVDEIVLGFIDCYSKHI